MFLLSLKYIQSIVYITINSLRIEKMHCVYICVNIFVYVYSVTYLLIHFWVKESKNREAGTKLKIIMNKDQTLPRS